VLFHARVVDRKTRQKKEVAVFRHGLQISNIFYTCRRLQISDRPSRLWVLNNLILPLNFSKWRFSAPNFRQENFLTIFPVNKKFELMLTGRAKAYSSSCPQAVTHRSTNRDRRTVTSFQPKRVPNYVTPPTPVPWRHLVNDIDLCRSA